MSVKDYELLLRVRADLQQALGGLDSVSKKLDATGGEAERTGKRASAAVDGLGKKFKGLQGLFAGLAIGAGIRAVLNAVTEQENAVAQLRATLKSTGNAAGLTEKQLVDFAGSLAKVTTFGEDAIVKLESLLGTFTALKGPIFKDAVVAILDISAKLGTDLKTASIQVGKALNDPVKGISALSDAGVNFTQQQKEVVAQLVKTGDVAGAQKLILAELKNEFGGSAEAAGNTFGGALKQLQHALGDLLKGDGGNLPDMRDSVKELTKTLQDPGIKQGFATLVSGLVTVTGAAAKGLAALADFTKFVGEEIARRQGYFSADDTAGIELALDRIKKKQDNLNKSLGSWMSIGSRGGIREQLAALDEEKARLEKLLSLGKMLKDQSPAASSTTAAGNGPQALPDITVTAPAQQSAEAVSKFVQAGAALQQKLIDLQAALDPTAKAWADYNKVVDDANAKAALAKQAPQANAAAIDAERDAIVKLAAAARDADIKKLAEADRAAFEQLRESLRTPAEASVENAVAQIKVLNDALSQGLITAEEYHAALTKVGMNSVTAAPTYQGVDAVVAGPAGELQKNIEAQDKLDQWYAEQQAATEARRETDLASEDAYQARRLEIKQQYAEQGQAIEQARQQLTLNIAQQGFANLASIAEVAYGKQSTQYRALFALSKAFAVAQAAVSLATNVSKASEYGFPQNIPFIIGAIAQGAQIASILAGASFSTGGYTGAGGVNEPAGVVHRGEIVWSQQDVARVGGVTVAEAIRLGNVPGYAAGGYVRAHMDTSGFANIASTGSSPAYQIQTPAASGGASSPVIQKHVHLWDKQQAVEEISSTPQFEEAVLHVVGRNPRAIKGAWGT